MKNLPVYFFTHFGNNNSSLPCNFHQPYVSDRGPTSQARSKQTILMGDRKDMKKLIITGIALCFMGLATPSFAAARQEQTQQDQRKHDDMNKDNMSKNSKSKKKMKKDNMKHDDMSKDSPKT